MTDPLTLEPFAWKASGQMRVQIERHAGKLSFLISFVLSDAFGGKFQAFCSSHEWHLDQLYGAIFGFAAIEIGCLLALYTLLVGDTPTTRRIGNTRSFKRYVTFVRAGIWISGATALVSIPILVVTPVLSSPFDPRTILASIWYALAISMFAALFRVISIAQMLIEANWNGD